MELSIHRVAEGKKSYMPLLLMADEEEDMIDRYIGVGDMYVMHDGERPVAVAVVVTCGAPEEAEGADVEIKNLAVAPEYRRKGLGRMMIEHVCALSPKGVSVFVGTGETPETMDFYQKCGFVYSHRVKDFFIENYTKPIVDHGILLRDMIYFVRRVL